MAVGDGKFALYANVRPPLTAGDYLMTANQVMTADGPTGALDRSVLKVAEQATNVRVRSARFALPPDQVLSVFPPANTEGSYGMRLPQIVIKRRTLPWERTVTADAAVPWLALVLVAEGEAELQLNQPVAECVTVGRSLPGLADVELGSCLVIQRSMVEDLFPTQEDVRLLAHAREVDIDDTELMMGDDDGFLAVVVSNRLPLAGRDADGNELPVKYLACLVSLEGQFDLLPPQPSGFVVATSFPFAGDVRYVSAGSSDKTKMDLVEAAALDVSIETAAEERYTLAVERPVAPGTASQAAVVAGTLNAEWQHADKAAAFSDVYVDMARDFSTTTYHGGVLGDPTYRFPVLLHWSFTSIGDRTFQSLMENLDSGLLGTLPSPADTDEAPEALGREPLELVETGHVGLVHRTRRGDTVRSWYRGPLLPHPSTDPDDARLELAHAADQLRIVVPDGREDLSLAGAFEIGRMLALARPSIVASLLRWRQIAYSTARQSTILDYVNTSVFGGLLDGVELETAGAVLQGFVLGGLLDQPDVFLGPPSTPVTPGVPLGDVVGDVTDAVGRGYGIGRQVLSGTPGTVLGRLGGIEARTAEAPAALTEAQLAARLDDALLDLVTDTLGDRVLLRTAPRRRGVTGDAYRGGARLDGALRVDANPNVARRRRDALDRLLRARRAQQEEDR